MKRLSRTDGHRKALLRNLATSFFKHEKIETTTTKAKEISKVVERLITQARRSDAAPLVYADQTYGTHSRFAVRSPRPITDQIAAFMR